MPRIIRPFGQLSADNRLGSFPVTGPTVAAQSGVSVKNATRAVEFLKTAAPYELGLCEPFPFGMMYPVYLRGQSYLVARQDGKVK